LFLSIPLYRAAARRPAARRRPHNDWPGPSGTEVTGIVTSADPQTREITIEHETYVMPEEAGGHPSSRRPARESFAIMRRKAIRK
jgi:hypothetical protein